MTITSPALYRFCSERTRTEMGGLAVWNFVTGVQLRVCDSVVCTGTGVNLHNSSQGHVGMGALFIGRAV